MWFDKQVARLESELFAVFLPGHMIPSNVHKHLKHDTFIFSSKIYSSVCIYTQLPIGVFEVLQLGPTCSR